MKNRLSGTKSLAVSISNALVWVKRDKLPTTRCRLSLGLQFAPCFLMCSFLWNSASFRAALKTEKEKTDANVRMKQFL